MDGLRAAVTAELGAPWLLVNAAGVFFEHEVTELSLQQWDLVMDVNARGTFLTCRALLPAMQRGGLRLHRQHRLDRRAQWRSHPRGLQRLEGRGRDVHAQPRDRLRAARRARELRRPGLIDTPMADWIRLDALRLAAFERSLPAGPHRHARPTSRTPSRSWPRTARRTCTAVRWSSMEESRPEAALLAGEGLVTSVHNQFAWCAWTARSARPRSPAGYGAAARRRRPRRGARTARPLPARRGRAAAPRILLRGGFRNEEKVVAANVDLLVIVAAVAVPRSAPA